MSATQAQSGVDPLAVDDDLRRWIEDTAGGPVTDVSQVSGGNRHRTYGVTVSGPAGTTGLILRAGVAGGAGETVSPLRREAAAYRVLAGSAVPVPRLLAEHPKREAILVSRLPGHSELSSAGDPQQRAAVANDLMLALAALHRVDVRSLDLGPLGPVGGLRKHVAGEIAAWRERYQATGRLDPVIELGLAWCQAHVPDHDGVPSLVHGDVGPGNFLFADGAVTALLDWEFAHLGDPYDDLATLSLRMVHGGMDGFADLVGAYVAASGTGLDAGRLAFHQVLAALRWVILRHAAAGEPADSRIANRMMSQVLHRRLLLEALALATDHPLPPRPQPPADPSPRTPLYDAVADLLRSDVLPAVSGQATASLKTVARVVKYLREADRLGGLAGEATAAALRSLAPDAHDDLATAAARRIRAGDVVTHYALDALATVVGWETELLRPAMGRLADRPLPTAPDTIGPAT